VRAKRTISRFPDLATSRPFRSRALSAVECKRIGIRCARNPGKNPTKHANIRLRGKNNRAIGEEFMLRHVTILLSLCTAIMHAGPLAAQQAYPSKPVRLIVPFPLGGANDIVARLIGQRLNFSSFGSGSSAHLIGEMFKRMAGIDIMHVPYKGGGPALAAVIAGEVQMTFSNQVLADADTRTQLLSRGLEPAATTPEEFARHIGAEIERWNIVIGESGIRARAE
jgi:tripartite-type tricarboxylate transporter receptor subunit TctC